MNFRASFCNPFEKDIIELGKIDKDKIFDVFENINWSDYLIRMKDANQSEIHYSPSLEIENIDNKNGLSISAIDENEWYIFYKRPKLVKKFFGLSEKIDNNYLTEIHGMKVKDVIDCLNALIGNDLPFLENKIK